MTYRELHPTTPLRPFVKSYYIYDSDYDGVLDDTVFPSGCMEIIFNLGPGQWQTEAGSGYCTTPPIELWGQLIRPLAVRSIGKNTMLGIRFFPHGAAHFFKEDIALYNNQVADYGYSAGSSAKALHDQLLENKDWSKRIGLVDRFLLQRLSHSEKRLSKALVVSNVMHAIKQDEFFDKMEDLASRYGITSRYLQKLFVKHTGLTPKLYQRISRFQNSLRLISKKDTPLTSIAYDCGYFDQSHFIREFKSFTGLTPSSYPAAISPIATAFTNP